MPRTKLDKANEEEKGVSLKEGEARIVNKKSGKEMVVNAIHAIQVMSRQGWDITDLNMDINEGVKICDNYNIDYNVPATKSNLLEVIQRRF